MDLNDFKEVEEKVMEIKYTSWKKLGDYINLARKGLELESKGHFQMALDKERNDRRVQDSTDRRETL